MPTQYISAFQKEVAEKICAAPGEHNMLSLQTQIFGKPSIVDKVPKTDFHPKPKVDSAILKIEVYENSLIENYNIFNKLISAAFRQKRKTLLNSLSNLPEFSKEEIEQLLEEADIAPLSRPQHLSIEDWKNIISSLD